VSDRINLGDLDRIEIASLEQWRSWLAANHRQTQSIWVVTWKKASGGPHVPYGDIRDEALCWGWIDSRPAKLDASRSMLLLSPRRPGSGWSAVNKGRIEVLRKSGRLAAAGLAAIERAKADGAWDILNGVETLEPPADVAAALAKARATARFEAFAPSSRRAILEWIALAKRPETRARRVAEAARLAALGLRANFPEARGR
jgi:uncharacterized protein YdeI (YjbR/CyaY-like superfamily)